MKDLVNLIQKYTIQQDWKIKKICQPLQRFLGISVFGYYKMKQSGEFYIVANYPEEMEYYYSSTLYQSNPYLKAPSLFRSGCAITTPSFDPDSCAIIHKRFRVKNLFIIIERTGEEMEGFLFGTTTDNICDNERYFSLINVLQSFSRYFLREAKLMLSKMPLDAVNLKELRGNAFFQPDPSTPLLCADRQLEQLLKQLTPLSARERQCLELFKKGYSAQATAAILGLSQRTVESYFEHIKHKLGCQSKSELLNL